MTTAPITTLFRCALLGALLVLAGCATGPVVNACVHYDPVNCPDVSPV